MAQILTTKARAYVNHGRWIADCPFPYCANAMALEPRQGMFQCGGQGGCQQLAEVEWPADPDGIWEALSKRPVPGTRNWFPTGHTIALRASLPNGQSVKQLDDETAKYMGE
jgi:hypothetical protein